MQTIRLTVPAEPAYARSVRMMAANLAVLGEMTVDDIEDMRMAAEEGFIRLRHRARDHGDCLRGRAPSALSIGP